ncbi:hypothetical protein [Aromatoleum sp.]|uniref:hypothetical protein n=1 Tax=Aromatoleum sp. TaxID=2307007 RepID=UPI002FC846CC
MSLPTDEQRKAPPPPSRAAKPSLIESETAPRRPANGDAPNLRMLDELESVVRPSAGRSDRHGSGWVVAMALSAAAIAGVWWWSQQDAANLLPSLDGTAESVLAGVPAVAEPHAAASASATPVAVTAARIEMLPPDMSARPAAAKMPTEAAQGAAEPAPTLSATTAAQGSKIRTERTLKGVTRSSATSPVAEPKRTANTEPVARMRRVASAPGPITRTRTQPSSPAGNRMDADVLLLSALLDHVSTEGQGDPLASPNPVTLAQIVRRCESRSGKTAAQVRECRRRICEGYWGKAEACPARLAPKTKS